jgi:hypothetical protein
VKKRLHLAHVFRRLRRIPESSESPDSRRSSEIDHHTEAPAAIGTYSQAVRAGDTVYLSGQIPLDPKTMKLVEGEFRGARAPRVR